MMLFLTALSISRVQSSSSAFPTVSYQRRPQVLVIAMVCQWSVGADCGSVLWRGRAYGVPREADGR